MAFEKEQLYATKTYILYPHLPEHVARHISPTDRLEETWNLAKAIHLKVMGARWSNLKEIKPHTFIGSGLVDEITPFLQENAIDLVILDASLSPIQQRNLEKKWGVKVIDRTGLILEIFGARAKTAEGALQVELAALTYQKSRLVRSWTHLERQRGGLGFIGGPGESQLEIDRRLITHRIDALEHQLEKVKRRRSLHRKNRQKVPYPVVALVGYTNAGKSTLFNTLTRASVLAENMLFATLDPTMRLLRLPSGRHVILSDTVGFISDLPTLLVAAFQATLEEVTAADLILHVRDAANSNADAQAEDVYHVLSQLGIDEHSGKILEVLNKGDLLPDFSKTLVSQGPLFISALQSKGIKRLCQAIDNYFDQFTHLYCFKLSSLEGKALAWLHTHGTVTSKNYQKNAKDPNTLFVEVYVKLTERDFDKFQSYFENVQGNRVLPSSKTPLTIDPTQV